ncbi:hypothetical protein ECG_02445 [Echinococcus granulosus]|uniref:Uncharacterized protein n=1 Tax=Echinococcus granulosus TaxID=6210 RepID=U6JGP0_ECHGR|nr:hypothetical protein ECG_02445 [Echinococcus granulosus]CDS23222.1 hypothetical protein EgrG_002036600 [Echinococcus granulosus]CDS23228.1 hypothetical protein EgrG_002036700 [Echinococcus granulosus]
MDCKQISLLCFFVIVTIACAAKGRGGNIELSADGTPADMRPEVVEEAKAMSQLVNYLVREAFATVVCPLGGWRQMVWRQRAKELFPQIGLLCHDFSSLLCDMSGIEGKHLLCVRSSAFCRIFRDSTAAPLVSDHVIVEASASQVICGYLSFPTCPYRALLLNSFSTGSDKVTNGGKRASECRKYGGFTPISLLCDGEKPSRKSGPVGKMVNSPMDNWDIPLEEEAVAFIFAKPLVGSSYPSLLEGLRGIISICSKYLQPDFIFATTHGDMK